METKKSIFDTLSKINVNEKTEKKNGLTYLSWAWAWGIVKNQYPSTTYEVVNYDGKPYLHDIKLGYIITTNVTIDGETLPMSLPVMDGANKAQKDHEYNYKVKEYANGKWTGKFIDRNVEAATMFDINTAIMRCLTKNLAMFGLGHYIYAGEDLPEQIKEPVKKPEKGRPILTMDKIEKVNAALKEGSTTIDFLELNYTISPEIKSLLTPKI